MIRAMLRIRFSGLFHSLSYGAKSRTTRIAMAAALAMAGLSIGFLFFTWFEAVAAPFYEMGAGFFYFTLFLVIDFCLMVIGCIFTAKSELFEAKDNELLLSLPIPPSSILFVRITLLVLLNYLFQLAVAIPAAVCWLRHCPVTPAGCIAFLLTCLLLPLTATALSALLGWLISMVTRRIRNKTLFTTVLTLAFLGLYFTWYTKLLQSMADLVTTGAALAERVRGVQPLYSMSRAISDGNLPDLLLSLTVMLVPFLLVCRVLSATYLKTLSTNRGFSKITYREKAAKKGSAFGALYRRELFKLLSSASYLMNCALGVFIMVLAAGFLMVKGGTLAGMLPVLAQFGISDSVLAVVVTAMLCFLCTMTTLTAPSISLEGKNLWIAQSLPVPTGMILRAKLALHLSVSIPPLLLLQLVLAVLLKLPAAETVLLLLAPQLFGLFLGLLGLMTNLLLPNLSWLNETAAVKNSGSVMAVIFGGWLLAAVPAVLCFAVPAIPPTLLLFGFCAVLLLGCVLLHHWLNTKGTKIYRSL